MKRFPRAVITVLGLLLVFIATWSCGPKSDTGDTAGPPQDGFRPGGPPGGGEPRGGSPVRQLMMKLDKGENSLRMISNALRSNPPAWDKIQSQTAEYALNAGKLGTFDAPRGSKDSWTKQTEAFAKSATALDNAAKAKDLSAAQAAESKLNGSCMECHREHRGGPGGPGGDGPRGGGRGGPGRPGGPPGGGPPGGGRPGGA
jgi:hypothetical protein